MLKHKTSTVIITVLLSVLLFTCIAFAACGEEPTPTPEPEPTPTPSTSVVTKSFTFTPEFGGEYIFFDNIYFEELYVTTNGEEIYPSADGEYRLTSRTTYVISFKGCKELSYELTYDISDDREVTLAPGEERIVKLGKMYDEIKTITTGNDDIKITGIYTGSPDDLEKHGNLPDVAMSSYTLPWRSGDHYAVVKNESNEILSMDLHFSEPLPDGVADNNGNSTGTFHSDGEISVCIHIVDIPEGNYTLSLEGIAEYGLFAPVIYDEVLNSYVTRYSSETIAFSMGAVDDLYIFFNTRAIGEYIWTLKKSEDLYDYRINGDIYYSNELYVTQGGSVEIDFYVNGQETDVPLEIYNDALYSYSMDNNVLTLNSDCIVNGSGFIIRVVYPETPGSAIPANTPDLRIVPTLAEPFAGVTFETSNDRTFMTWENVPNLYSFTYSVNSGEEREVTAGENTSLDITSYLPENVRRALVEITDVTYSYPVYDNSGEPTGETRKVVHDDVMKFVAEY